MWLAPYILLYIAENFIISHSTLHVNRQVPVPYLENIGSGRWCAWCLCTQHWRDKVLRFGGWLWDRIALHQCLQPHSDFRRWCWEDIQLSVVITRSNSSRYYIWHRDDSNKSLTSNSQQTPHTSPSMANYGVSIMRILKKIDRVLMAPHCIRIMQTIKFCIQTQCSTYPIQLSTQWPHIYATCARNSALRTIKMPQQAIWNSSAAFEIHLATHWPNMLPDPDSCLCKPLIVFSRCWICWSRASTASSSSTTRCVYSCLIPLAVISCNVLKLTHCGLVTSYCGRDLGQHWFR